MNEAFYEFSLRVGPLVLLVLLGFVAGKWGRVNRDPIGRLLIYFLTPGMVLSGIIKSPLEPKNALIPLSFFLLCTALCFLSLKTFAKWIVKDKSDRHIVALGCGDANSGYFAIPVGTALLGEQSLPYIILISMGFVLYENTVGYFVAARGSLSFKESLRRVFKLPAVYAVFFALLLKAAGVASLPGPLDELGKSFRATYSVLGMMMIGMGLSSLKGLQFDFRYLAASFFGKFALWPLILGAGSYFGLASALGIPPHFEILLIFTGFLPMAANMVAISSDVKASVEKSATAVFLSILMSWILLPLLFY